MTTIRGPLQDVLQGEVTPQALVDKEIEKEVICSYVPLRPSQPLIYTFNRWKRNSMLLLPPESSRNRTPVYNIEVSLNLNPFTPLSYVTTIRRGDTEDGPIVGEFE